MNEKNILLLASIALAVFPSAMFAQNSSSGEVVGSPEACHVFEDASERVDCYDQLTGYSSEEIASVGQPTIPSETDPLGDQWQLQTESSALDDRTDVWLSVDSSNTQPNQVNRPERARLYARCMNNSTNLFIVFNDYTSDNQNVRYRIDEGEVASAWMQTMNGGDGIGIWSGGTAIPFIRRLFDGENLVVSYRSYTNNSLEFVFDISGLRERIPVLAQNCGWTP